MCGSVCVATPFTASSFAHGRETLVRSARNVSSRVRWWFQEVHMSRSLCPRWWRKVLVWLTLGEQWTSTGRRRATFLLVAASSTQQYKVLNWSSAGSARSLKAQTIHTVNGHRQVSCTLNRCLFVLDFSFHRLKTPRCHHDQRLMRVRMKTLLQLLLVLTLARSIVLLWESSLSIKLSSLMRHTRPAK